MTDNDARRIEDKVDGIALALARLEGSLSPTLTALTDRQQEADDRIDDVEKRANERLDDHEERLRGQEKFRYAVPSVTLLSLLLSVATLAYYALLR